MQLVGAILPLVTLALIIALIVRSRFTARPLSFTLPRWSFRRPQPRKRAQLIPFDRAKMDADLDRLLRQKR